MSALSSYFLRDNHKQLLILDLFFEKYLIFCIFIRIIQFDPLSHLNITTQTHFDRKKMDNFSNFSLAIHKFKHVRAYTHI